MDEKIKAAIKSVEDLTADFLKLLGFDSSHTANADQAPASALPAIEINTDGVMQGEGCTYVPTQKRSYLAKVCSGKVVGVVWHYTDTGSAPGSALKLAQRLAQPGGRQSSWHVVIGRDGTIVQSVPFTMGSWHAGSPSAKLFAPSKVVTGFWSLDPAGKLGANSLFAGIELECVGEVRKTDTGWRGWPFGKKVPGEGPGVPVSSDAVVEAKDATGRIRYWQNYTQAQEDAAERILMALDRWGNVDRSQCSFSHQQIDPDRRTDPGPVWMDQVLPRVLGRVYG